MRNRYVWVVWATDDNTLICVADTAPIAMATAARDCGCDEIGWTEMDDGWTYLNNMWGYIIRKCVVKVDPPQEDT